jgi:3-hydroxyisobutyrate dehydrogenase-like beta-hydroxyacid dehydrogenase
VSAPEQGRRVGFVGLGNMGGRITARLVAAGHPVLGYDLDPAAAGKCGATPAGSVAEVVQGSDVVLLSLPDSRVVEPVVRGPGGILAAGRPGQLVIDLSTAAPESTVAVAAELAGRGVEFLDAGISGGAAAAEKGTLTLMVGADRTTVDRVGWVLEPFAAKLVAMGRVGAGHSTKLLNNFLNAIALSATAEVMVAAKKAGLDLGAVLEVLNSSSGVNFATANRFPSIIRGDYLEGGLTCDLMTKDVVLYVDHVRALGVPSLNAAGPLASFGLAANLGYGGQISNRVVDAIGDVAGHVRLHEQPDDVEDRGQ